ncbi:MAG: hypothetical protein E7254_01090 [Lachnospiraceae bacterium]|nr:hypothetical protein [Lachnospiraceae bacterium]
MNKEIIISIALTSLVILAFSPVGASVALKLAVEMGFSKYWKAENYQLPYDGIMGELPTRAPYNMTKYKLAVPDGYKEGPMQIIKGNYYLWIQEFESDDSKVTFKQDLLDNYSLVQLMPIETVEKEVSGRKIVITSYEDKVIAEYKGDNYYMDIIIEGKDATVEMAEKFAGNITDR